MDQVGALLGAMTLTGFSIYGLLWKAGKPSRKFPLCWSYKVPMIQTGLPMFIPGSVMKYLQIHDLPTKAVSRYICPKGHCQLWYVPRFGNTEKAFFLREEL